MKTGGGQGGGPRAGRLAGPVDVALARASDTIPQRLNGGGVLYSLKWDGYRGAVVRGTRTARIWSRQGVDLTAAFPEISEAAVRDIPPGCVLDGELVILDAALGRTDFARLGRRLGAGPRTVAAERRAHPASWVGFDVLAVAGIDVRPQSWTSSRPRSRGRSSTGTAAAVGPRLRPVPREAVTGP